MAIWRADLLKAKLEAGDARARRERLRLLLAGDGSAPAALTNRQLDAALTEFLKALALDRASDAAAETFTTVDQWIVDRLLDGRGDRLISAATRSARLAHIRDKARRGGRTPPHHVARSIEMPRESWEKLRHLTPALGARTAGEAVSSLIGEWLSRPKKLPPQRPEASLKQYSLDVETEAKPAVKAPRQQRRKPAT